MPLLTELGSGFGFRGYKDAAPLALDVIGNPPHPRPQVHRRDESVIKTSRRKPAAKSARGRKRSDSALITWRK
jgi:hypothetical protein